MNIVNGARENVSRYEQSYIRSHFPEMVKTGSAEDLKRLLDSKVIRQADINRIDHSQSSYDTPYDGDLCRE